MGSLADSMTTTLRGNLSGSAGGRASVASGFFSRFGLGSSRAICRASPRSSIPLVRVGGGDEALAPRTEYQPLELLELELKFGTFRLRINLLRLH